MVEFFIGDEEALLRDPSYAPVTTAFVIVESGKGYMMLYNKYRRLWELTGGMIEQGETPKQCAVRECREESGQRIADPRFIGLAKLQDRASAYRKEDGIEYSAIYHVYLDEEEQFKENDEIKELRWWKFGDEEQDFCRASLEYLRFCCSMLEQGGATE